MLDRTERVTQHKHCFVESAKTAKYGVFSLFSESAEAIILI